MSMVDQIHTDDKSTKPPLPIYGNPDYAKGYDLVIHDECAAGHQRSRRWSKAVLEAAPRRHPRRQSPLRHAQLPLRRLRTSR